ncbi:MAG: T9SS type A sorting domain-containing protein [Bacteroidota bacterium]|nr:T9SS type A sorting domain-containing protein [Bacteroidota bacterium]
MKNCMYKFLFTVCLGLGISFTNPSFASHMIGSEIFYACTPTPNIYLVTLKYYQDCSGGSVCSNCPSGPLSNTCSRTVNIASGSCSGSFSQALLIDTVASGFDVVQLCNSTISICSNCGSRTPGSFSPGIEVYTFKGLVNLGNLPANCCMVNISYSECCRNAAITTLSNPSSLIFYSVAIINRCTSPCNSSPIFNNPLSFVVCAGQDAQISTNASDPDGDSLSYAFGYSLTGPGSSAPYVSPYSPIVPFPYLGAPLQSPPYSPPIGININPLTGDIRFRPLGVFVANLVIEVKQWKTIGGVPTLMGITRRDHQIYSQICAANSSVTVRKYDSTGASLGSLIYTGDSIRICENQRFCRIYSAFKNADYDTTDLSWSNPTNMPGATFVPLYNPLLRAINGPKLDSMKFCWTAPSNSGRNTPYVFVLTSKDRICPIPAKSSRTIVIYVNPGPEAIINKIITGSHTRKFKYTRTNSISNNPAQTKWQIETSPNSNAFTTINADSISSYSFIQSGRYKIILNLSGGACGSYLIYDSIDISLLLTLVSFNNVKCKGELSGQAVFTSSGTIGPVQYKFNNGAYQSSATFNNLGAGSYLFTLKDSLNQMDSIRLAITEPTTAMALSANLSTGILCHGDYNATVILSVNNGSAPFQYKLSGSSYQGNNVFYYLNAGTKTFFAIDSIGCQATTSILINDVPTIIKSMHYTNARCLGSNDGTAGIILTGGTPPYQYSWNTIPVQTSFNAINLHPGYATVTVTDSNACMLKDSVLINYKPIYNGQEICAVTVDTISGHNRIVWNKRQDVGVALFRLYTSSSMAGPFILFNSTSFTNQSSVIDITSMPAQAYYYLIKAVDSCGNESTASEVHRAISGTAITLGNSMNSIVWIPYLGSVFANFQLVLRSVNGGSFVSIKQIPISATSYIDSLPPSGAIRYLIELTQSINCTAGTGNNIRILSNVMNVMPSGITEIDEANAFEVYPNPTSGNIKVSAIKPGVYLKSIEVINILGSTVKIQITGNRSQEAIVDMEGLADGVYHLQILTDKGVSYPVKIILNRSR